MIRLKRDGRWKGNIVLAVIVSMVLLGMMISSLFSALAAAVCGVYFLVAKEERIMETLFFLLPFATIFKLSPSSTSLVTILWMFGMLVFVMKRGAVLRLTFMQLLGVLFVVYIFFIDILHGGVNVTELIKHSVGILFLGYILEYRDKKTIRNIILAMAVGLYLSSFIALFADSIPNFYSYVRKVGHGIVIQNRFSGMNGDPNYYSVSLVLVLMGALVMYKENKRFFWIAFGATCFLGVQTYSKSFLLALLVVVVVSFVVLARAKRGKLAFACFVALLAIGGYLISTGYFYSVTLLLNRFITSATNISDLTTGRSDIWKDYFAVFNSNILNFIFGNGISAPLVGGKGAHNFYLEMMYYLGIFGSLLFLFYCGTGYVRAARETKGRVTVGKTTILLIMALYFGLQMLFYNELYFHIAFVLLLSLYESADVRV